MISAISNQGKLHFMFSQESMNQQKELNEAIKEGVNRPTYNYQAGATHDDKRSQLLLGEEKEKFVPLKKISNE